MRAKVIFHFKKIQINNQDRININTNLLPVPYPGMLYEECVNKWGYIQGKRISYVYFSGRMWEWVIANLCWNAYRNACDWRGHEIHHKSISNDRLHKLCHEQSVNVNIVGHLNLMDQLESCNSKTMGCLLLSRFNNFPLIFLMSLPPKGYSESTTDWPIYSFY